MCVSGFIGKKAQSLYAHMCGCVKYKATLKKEKNENNEIYIETIKILKYIYIYIICINAA